ncbi:MAG: hypothetical protein WCS94_22150 [Verrucomicrobiota bacterium]
MSIDYKKVQATRRKTLYPLSSKQVSTHRMVIASTLSIQMNVNAIRQIMRITPEQVRQLVAKGRRRGLVASLKNLANNYQPGGSR